MVTVEFLLSVFQLFKQGCVDKILAGPMYLPAQAKSIRQHRVPQLAMLPDTNCTFASGPAADDCITRWSPWVVYPWVEDTDRSQWPTEHFVHSAVAIRTRLVVAKA